MEYIVLFCRTIYFEMILTLVLLRESYHIKIILCK